MKPSQGIYRWPGYPEALPGEKLFFKSQALFQRVIDGIHDVVHQGCDFRLKQSLFVNGANLGQIDDRFFWKVRAIFKTSVMMNSSWDVFRIRMFEIFRNP